MSTREPHKHLFDTLVTTVVPVRGVTIEKGKTIRDTMTARDTLKQRKCKCGKIETYDLERKRVS